MLVYVTLFDQGYVDRALALARSFARWCPGDLLVMGCLDDESACVLGGMPLPATRVLSPGQFVTGTLLELKEHRSRAEFCWTAKPFLLEFALAACPDASWAVYLDADSLIFGNLSSALVANEASDCVLAPHDFSPDFTHFEPSVGRYNAGFAAFANDVRGRTALSEWRDLCADSVSATPSSDAYGDQKYLNGLADRWHVPADPAVKGINVAPWNMAKYRFGQVGSQVMVDDRPLLYFHFQGFGRVSEHWVLLYKGAQPVPGSVRDLVYRPYLAELRQARASVKGRDGAFPLPVPGFRKSARDIWNARRNLCFDRIG